MGKTDIALLTAKDYAVNSFKRLFKEPLYALVLSTLSFRVGNKSLNQRMSES